MDRRRFIVGAAGGLVALPLAAEAQQTKVYPVGHLSQGAPPPPGSKPLPGGFRMTLRDLGYIEGQNLILEIRGADERSERLPALGVELVALKPDVIVADSTPAALAASMQRQQFPS